MKVDIYSNAVAGGWTPLQGNDFLGGSEESLVLWAEALARTGKYEITIYLNFPNEHTPELHHNGVWYRHRSNFDFGKYRDILITWKDPQPWKMGTRAKLRLHWTGEVEPRFFSWYRSLSRLVCISDYHLSRMEGVPEGLGVAFPLGVDLDHLDSQKMDRVPNTMLYCSSPDRGLEQLLTDWPKIRENHPGIELRVAYGWRNFDASTQGNTRALLYKRHILKRMEQEGITYLGELDRDGIAQEYWKAEYWVLPLQNPDSELFCLNAIKARHCGATPVVNRIGALQNTVTAWIDYQTFTIGKNSGFKVEENTYPIQSWDQVVKQYWEPLFQEAGE